MKRKHLLKKQLTDGFSDSIGKLKGGLVGIFAIFGVFIAISLFLMVLAYMEGTAEEIVMNFVNGIFKGLFKK